MTVMRYELALTHKKFLMFVRLGSDEVEITRQSVWSSETVVLFSVNCPEFLECLESDKLSALRSREGQ